jgi:hypothetical protein
MKDFSNASFPPETISIMKNALDAAVASLPEPVSSVTVRSIAAVGKPHDNNDGDPVSRHFEAARVGGSAGHD